MGGLQGCLGGAGRRNLKLEEAGTILPDPRGMMTRRFIAAMLVLSVIAAACTDTGDEQSGDAAPSTGQRTVAAAPKNGACDDLDPSACLLPWPNDRLTRPDAGTPTGLRVDLPTDGVPTNIDGTRIDVSDQNRGDGFSPSSIAMVVIPGLDVERSKLPPSTDVGASLGTASPLVVLDVDANKRLPAWAELDAASTNPAATPLMIVPASALVEGHTHVIALRNLVRPNGQPIPPNEAYNARLNTPDAHTDTVIEGLRAAKLDANDMQLAWSFTVASGKSLSGRLRHMWADTRQAFEQKRPALKVNTATTAGAVTTLRGTFEVPNFLSGDGGPGEAMNNQTGGDGNPDGIPKHNGTLSTEFLCTVPAATGQSNTPPAMTPPANGPGVPVVLYGHGLLGTKEEALTIGAVGASAGIAFCALDWIGMSTADVPAVVDALADLSRFRTVPDRLQQGHLAWLTFGHLLATSNISNTDPAFFGTGDTPLIDPKRISFLGASQGGILGGVPSALTEDWTQVILGVPGMGYNLLLPRSVDFDKFAPAMNGAYPDPLDQALGRELIQLLWDRGENAGWAQHLTTDTYDGVPEKNVLLLEAFGDHQVANVSTEKLARTLGVPRRAPTLANGRSNDAEPLFDIPAIDALPTGGSGLVVWDFGTPAPPTINVAPRAGDDPHSKLATEPGALAMVAAFIDQDHQLIDVCDAKPCATPIG